MSEFDQTPEEPIAAPEPTEAAPAPEAPEQYAAPEQAPPQPTPVFDFEQPAPASAQTPPPQYGQAPPPQYGQTPPPQYQQAPPQYGQAPPPQYGQPVYAQEKPLHVPSLVIGILAIIFAFSTGFVGLILGIVGVVMAKNNKNEYKTGVGYGLSLAGLILGAVITVILIIAFAVLGTFGLASLAML